MENIGKETDDDLKFIFNQLYKGIKKNRKKKKENPVCEWKGCNVEERFSDCEALFWHVKIMRLGKILHLSIESILVFGKAVKIIYKKETFRKPHS